MNPGTARPPGTGAISHPLPELGDPLSPREIEVVRLVAVGRMNQEISDQLGISTKTVDTHIGRAKEKSGARNRVELVLWWLKNGGAS